MSNLVDIQNKIKELQKQEQEIKALEFDKTVQEIIEKMTVYGITVKDLDTVGGRVRKTAPTGTKQAAAKYRGPNGETWSGRGLTPRWLVALVAQGQSKEDFFIKE